MSNNEIKVAGYVKKQVYNGDIEYRNFNPDLVGLQLTSDGGTTLFTMGNFSITTNMDPKVDKNFVTTGFSDFVSLDSLKLTIEETKTLLDNNAGAFLNLDKSQLKYYALFSSLSEFVRVSLEEIITKWPASLYATPLSISDIGASVIGLTYENYVYDIISNTASFKVNNTYLANKFSINYLKNGTIADTFNETNDLRNLTVNYLSYVIFVNGVEFPVLNFTGSTSLKNDYLYFNVKGDVFSGQPTTVSYHIKPNKTKGEEFFNALTEFEGYLLNRMSYPKYTATFSFPIKSETGIILYTEKTITWPVTDGYNIDFDSGEYISYATELLDISDNSDLYNSNLMTRFLVSESISAFDTTPVHLDEEHMDTSGQKINKTLNIYGREYDELNNYIVGISFAHNVTYNKLDNTPDKYLKDLAKVLGWELINSVIENDLLSNYVKTAKSNYAGQSVGLTPVEADVELWRRLILNSPWIWKSKGARKSVEFLLRFIGTPQGLVEFNEYVYRADAPINRELFYKALELNGLDTDLAKYPIDSDGYPRFFDDTPDMYFQSNGLWYRETGGANSVIDILTGNNPHVGPYDGGYKYINQLRTLIPNFSAVTISGETIMSGSTNLFINYNLGQITDYTGLTYVDVVNDDGTDLSDCVVVTSEIVKDPMPTDFLSACGCPCGTEDDSLSVCVKKVTPPVPKPCSTLGFEPKKDPDTGYYVFQYYQYNQDGTVYTANGNNVVLTSIFTDRECCKALGGSSVYTDYIDPKTNIVSSGYACCHSPRCGCNISCNWYLNAKPIDLPVGSPTATPFCEFTTLYGSGVKKVVTPDGSNCPPNWTTPVPNTVDPYTGEVGIGCKLTTYGLQNFDTLINFYKMRADKKDCCNLNFPVRTAPNTQYRIYSKIVYSPKEGYYVDYPFNTLTTQQVKCTTLNYTTTFAGQLPLLQVETPWSFTPIAVGTQLYVSNTTGAAPYTALNGNYPIEVNSLSNTFNTGLAINNKYVLQITKGVVTNIINFNMLPNC